MTNKDLYTRHYLKISFLLFFILTFCFFLFSFSSSAILARISTPLFYVFAIGMLGVLAVYKMRFGKIRFNSEKSTNKVENEQEDKE